MVEFCWRMVCVKCGDDSDCIVSLTPGRLGNVAAGFEVVDDVRMLLDCMAYALRDSLYCACHIQLANLIYC